MIRYDYNPSIHDDSGLFPVFMLDSSDHRTGKTGLTLTVTASYEGGAFASISPTVTERGSGWYWLNFSAVSLGFAGITAIHITAAGADPNDTLLIEQSHDYRADVQLWRGAQPDGLGDGAVPASMTTIAGGDGAASDLRTFIETGGLATKSQIAAEVLGSVVDGAGTTLVQALRGFVAALLGKTSRVGGTRKFRNRADNKDVISATTNQNGDRTSVTLDLS